MSIRLEMLQVARLATQVLGESAALIEAFVRSKQHADGGFVDRNGESDLYYTSFAIDALTALQVPLPEDELKGYLTSFGTGEELDFVHLCCLSRCWSALERNHPSVPGTLEKLESYRTEDGGYNQAPDAKTGSAYGAFLAYGAYADHGLTNPNVDGISSSLGSLLDEEKGGWANETTIPVANIPATAAAITIYRNLRQPIPPKTPQWMLESLHAQGGFAPFPCAPMPDLLSTAVALHALDGLQAPIEPIRESCLDFIDTLWTAEGGFYGTWDDDVLDIEYSYYGLLALGHLAL